MYKRMLGDFIGWDLFDRKCRYCSEPITHRRPRANFCNIKCIHKHRLKTDIVYKLRCRLRTRLRSTIKNNSKKGSAVGDLGCTVEELKQHLESQFQQGMTWDNWSFKGWHIDHIKPLCSFDLTKREELMKACHYTNLQPLWAKDNLKKGSNF